MVTYKNILNIVESYVEKCSRNGPTNTSGIITPKGEIPVFEPKEYELTTDELETIANAMCNRYGLEISKADGKLEISKDKFILWDPTHKTELDFSNFIHWQNEIDFTNRGTTTDGKLTTYRAYTLEEVLEAYNEMPNMMKDAMGGVLFKEYGSAYNTYHNGRVDNPIILTHDCFNRKLRGGNFDIQRVMYHEGAHAIERVYGEKYRNYIFSNTSEYNKAMFKNMDDGGKLFASKYGEETYVDRLHDGRYRRHSEDFAETMSMVALSRTNHNRNPKIDDLYDMNDFKKDHKHTWKYCEDILDGKTDYKKLTTYA